MDFIKLLCNLFHSKKNTTQSSISLENFIQDVLIKQIGQIKKEYPYLAFLLISTGIEFLGKCINSANFQDPGHSSNDFKNALGCFDSLKKYNSIDLYSTIRCGLCHSMQPKPGIKLSDSMPQSLDKQGSIINIDNYYSDFKSACNDLLTSPQSFLPKNRSLTLDFIKIDSDGSGNSASGATANY